MQDLKQKNSILNRELNPGIQISVLMLYQLSHARQVRVHDRINLLVFLSNLQLFRHFPYVTAHSPTLPSLYLRHNSFSNPSVASPTSQLILQSFRYFTYVTAHSPTLPLLHLRHSSFSNPSFTSPMSQDFHLHHLACCPCLSQIFQKEMERESNDLDYPH